MSLDSIDSIAQRTRIQTSENKRIRRELEICIEQYQRIRISVRILSTSSPVDNVAKHLEPALRNTLTFPAWESGRLNICRAVIAMFVDDEHLLQLQKEPFPRPTIFFSLFLPRITRSQCVYVLLVSGLHEKRVQATVKTTPDRLSRWTKGFRVYHRVHPFRTSIPPAHSSP